MSLQPPHNARIYESSISQYWFVGDTVFVNAKKGTTDLQTEQKELADFKKILGGRKVYGVMDVSDASTASKEARDQNAVELPLMFHAIAFIVRNPLARMLAHIYLGIIQPNFPIKMCSSEKEAVAWIDSQKNQ